ncbi:MAG TPA: EamA family transporter [Alphaproteobacteria bacterium]|nr:EamA family transporter [Alphaproteobacteria bacterium]
MPLALPAALLVLAAALMHASWNALVKSAGDRAAGDRALAMAFTAFWPMLPALAAALFWLPAPARASWPFLVGSMVIHIGYYIGLVKAYRYGDLSQVYPLARGSAPVLVALTSALAVGELLTARAFLGIGLVSLGTASLTFERGRPQGDELRAVLYALFIALTIVAYTIVDGIGVRRSGTPLGYIAWLFTIDGIPFALATAVWRRGQLIAYFRSTWFTPLVGGMLSLLAYGIAIWAMSFGALGQVAALRETGVIFAAVIGSLFLKEPFGRRRILAAAIVAAGIIVLQTSR